MPNLKQYQRQKLKALILHASLFVFLMVSMLIWPNVSAQIFAPMGLIWVICYVRYEQICTKIEMLKELQRQSGQDKETLEYNPGRELGAWLRRIFRRDPKSRH